VVPVVFVDTQTVCTYVYYTAILVHMDPLLTLETGIMYVYDTF
jgi:hypothetical protein